MAPFLWDHFEFINQIFGDPTVRAIICKLFPRKDGVVFGVLKNVPFGLNNSSPHHVLVNRSDGTLAWCSIASGIQNPDVFRNDTLCQTYTLMKYLNIPIKGDRTQVQQAAVRMYFALLKHGPFYRKIMWYLNTHTLFYV